MPGIPEDKAQREMEFKVAMTVPSRMTVEEVISNLTTCISFGRPRITNLHDVPAPRPVQTVSAPL
jgi:hypothetical protein